MILLLSYYLYMLMTFLFFSEMFDVHLERLEIVLKQLAETGSKVKVEKCAFPLDMVKFLDHHMSVRGFRTDSSKVSAVTDWKVPSTVKEVHLFLGFCSYYQRIIRGF